MSDQHERVDNASFENEKEQRRRIRPAQLKVIPSEKASAFEVKSWPMLGELDDEATNALGYPKDFFEQKKLAQKRRLEELEARRALEEQQRLEAQEQEKAESEVPMITADELEQLRSAAESEGRESGYKAGHDEGFKQGLEEGQTKGLQQGRDEGFRQGQSQGLEEGREQGYKEGREQGLTEGEAIVMEQVERFRHLSDALSDPLRLIDSSVGDAVTHLVTGLFKTLAGRELAHDPGFIRDSIERALKLLPDTEQGAAIKLHPDDAALVETAVGREYIAAQHWKLQEDASLQPGDVRVQGETSEILWQLEERIAALVNEFLDNAADQDLSGRGFEQAHEAAVNKPVEPSGEQEAAPAQDAAEDSAAPGVAPAAPGTSA